MTTTQNMKELEKITSTDFVEIVKDEKEAKKFLEEFQKDLVFYNSKSIQQQKFFFRHWQKISEKELKRALDNSEISLRDYYGQNISEKLQKFYRSFVVQADNELWRRTNSQIPENEKDEYLRQKDKLLESLENQFENKLPLPTRQFFLYGPKEFFKNIQEKTHSEKSKIISESYKDTEKVLSFLKTQFKPPFPEEKEKLNITNILSTLQNFKKQLEVENHQVLNNIVNLEKGLVTPLPNESVLDKLDADFILNSTQQEIKKKQPQFDSISLPEPASGSSPSPVNFREFQDSIQFQLENLQKDVLFYRKEKAKYITSVMRPPHNHPHLVAVNTSQPGKKYSAEILDNFEAEIQKLKVLENSFNLAKDTVKQLEKISYTIENEKKSIVFEKVEKLARGIADFEHVHKNLSLTEKQNVDFLKKVVKSALVLDESKYYSTKIEEYTKKFQTGGFDDSNISVIGRIWNTFFKTDS